ncbi:MAG: hypothetical protein ACRC3H_05430 [Lachnospiraceae bacterium]
MIKKRIVVTVILLIVTIVIFIMCCAYPMFFGYDWSTILVWQTYSVLTALISLALLTASITWFVYMHRYSTKA